jgi:hypothetical protein
LGGTLQQRARASFDFTDLGRMQMCVQRAEAARQTLDVRAQQFETLIEDTHQTLIPAGRRPALSGSL